MGLRWRQTVWNTKPVSWKKHSDLRRLFATDCRVFRNEIGARPISPYRISRKLGLPPTLQCQLHFSGRANSTFDLLVSRHVETGQNVWNISNGNLECIKISGSDSFWRSTLTGAELQVRVGRLRRTYLPPSLFDISYKKLSIVWVIWSVKMQWLFTSAGVFLFFMALNVNTSPVRDFSKRPLMAVQQPKWNLFLTQVSYHNNTLQTSVCCYFLDWIVQG